MIQVFITGLLIGIVIGVIASLCFCHHWRLLDYAVIVSSFRKWTQKQRFLQNQLGNHSEAGLKETSAIGHDHKSRKTSYEEHKNRGRKGYKRVKEKKRRYSIEQTERKRGMTQKTTQKRHMTCPNLKLQHVQELEEKSLLNYSVFDRNSRDIIWKHSYASKIHIAACKAYDCWKETERDGWVKSTSSEGFKVYRKKRSNLPLDIIKGECLLPYPLKTCIADFFSEEGRNAMEETIAERKVIENLGKDDPGRQITYCYTVDKYPMVSVRDMVHCRETMLIKNNQEGIQSCPVMVVNTSVEVQACPVKKKRVRIDLAFAGTIFEMKSPSETQITMIIDVDVKGWLPKWLVNFAADECAYPPLRLRKYMKKKYSKFV